MQTNTITETTTRPDHRPDPAKIRRAIARRSFATLATTSPASRPHVAGVLFEAIGADLWVNTLRSSRKARNIAANPHVGVTIPIRRLPVGPPSTIQFQATADVVALDDPEINRLIGEGRLKSITGHGELHHPDGCFLRIGFGPRLVTYGLGMSLRKLIADPLGAGGSVVLEPRDDG